MSHNGIGKVTLIFDLMTMTNKGMGKEVNPFSSIFG